MRNATCADIVYELGFYVDQRMRIDCEHGWAACDAGAMPDQRRQLFNHEFTSQNEWTAGVLVEFGVLAGARRRTATADEIRLRRNLNPQDTTGRSASAP